MGLGNRAIAQVAGISENAVNAPQKEKKVKRKQKTINGYLGKD